MKAAPPLLLLRAAVCRTARVLFCVLLAVAPVKLRGQDMPTLIEVAAVSKLLPLLPEPPAGWTADKADGSTTEAAGLKITNVHRDYQKGTADDAPSVTINILDSFANQEYITTAVSGWSLSAETPEGYSKPLKIDEQPGFETYENDGKHGTLWLLVGKRFFLEIETRGLEPKELQEWLKRVDIKKLAEVK